MADVMVKKVPEIRPINAALKYLVIDFTFLYIGIANATVAGPSK